MRFLILFLALVSTLRAVIIPTSQTVDWSTAGVEGGIPTRTTISQTADAATYGNDSTAAATHLQSKINATASGQVCYIPAGTYRVSTALSVPSNITIRGDGPGLTIIKAVGAIGQSGVFSFGTFGGQMPYYPSTYSTAITAGATQGSTSITVSSAASISVGDRICITSINDGTEVKNLSTSNGAGGFLDGWGSSSGGAGTYTGGTRSAGQMVRVTAKSGNDLTISPQLYANYTTTPWATWMLAQGPSNSGVEDLTIYATNTGALRNILFDGAYNCWAKNVKGDFTDGDHVIADWSLHCEIRHCHFNDGFLHTSGGYDTMVALRAKATQCLVIDTIVERCHIGICLEWGAVGNVIAFNYTRREYDDSEAGGNRALYMGINGNHGLHPRFNLIEGNITDHILLDAFWSTSSYTTIFRNWTRGHSASSTPYSARGTKGTDYELNQARRAMDIWEGQTYVSVVGNVMGDSFTGTGSGTTALISNPTSRPYDNQIYERSYGYATTSDGGGTATLADPTATIIDHGNYSFKNAAQYWDAGIADHTIPDSMFLSAKPSFFGSLTWPAINPASPGSPTEQQIAEKIPAGYRYINGNEGYLGGDTTAPTITITVPTSSSTYSTGTAALTISGTAADETALSSVTVTMSGATTGSVTISGTTSWSGSTTLNAGVTTFTATATDSSSNTGTDTLTVTYTPVTSSTRTAPAPRYPRGNTPRR